MGIKIHKVKIDRIGMVDISTMVFPVVMYRYESVVLEKTLESTLNSKEIQPVHFKGVNPEYSLEGLMLKLKRQYLGHLMQRTDSMGIKP